MTDRQTELERRLERMEAQLDHLVAAVTAGGRAPHAQPGNGASLNGAQNTGAREESRSAFSAAAQQVDDGLRGVYGAAAVQANVADALYALGDPEALEALSRMVALAPKLEYAVAFVAAGPELLEEGLSLVRKQAAERGEDPRAMQQRVGRGVELLAQLTTQDSAGALTRLASAGPALAPLAEGAARAVRSLCEVEGDAALTRRFADTLTQLAEAETLDALTRLSLLAPKLEYAATFVAAGPELLDEGLALAREELAKVGDAAAMGARMTAAKQALLTLSEPVALRTLSTLGHRLDDLAPIALGAADGARALAEVEGAEAMRARLAEAVITLADPETLDSLVRLSALAPKLEYAAQFAAAGPELLEEGLALVRDKLGDTHEMNRRLEAALQLATTLGDPSSLAGLQAMARALPALQEPGVAEALRTLAGELPRVADLSAFALDLPARLERIAKNEGLPSLATLEPGFDAALRALVKVAEPRTLAALSRMAAEAEQLEKLLKALPLLTRLVEHMDLSRVEGLLDRLTRKETLELLQSLMEMAPGLVKVLQALPVQTHTLAVLETLNQAVEHAAKQDDTVGTWGLFRSLADERVQRAAGFALHMARELGQHLGEEPRRLSKGS